MPLDGGIVSRLQLHIACALSEQAAADAQCKVMNVCTQT
jgi:hypothetical protein